MCSFGKQRLPTCDVKLERNFLAKLVVAARSSRDINKKDIIGSYELCSYPQSLMNLSGLYECKNQSVIVQHLKEISSANITGSYYTNTGFSSEINCLLFCIGVLCNEVTLQDVVYYCRLFFALVYYAMKLPYKTLCTIADCFCIGVLCNEVTLQDVVYYCRLFLHWCIMQ